MAAFMGAGTISGRYTDPTDTASHRAVAAWAAAGFTVAEAFMVVEEVSTAAVAIINQTRWGASVDSGREAATVASLFWREVQFGNGKLRATREQKQVSDALVDVTGIEPATSCLQSTRSPS
jgi:hypothetical protein